MSFKSVLIVIVLILVAFGAGYGLGYWKLQMAEKEWTAAKEEMQTKITSMEKELTVAKAREKLWEMPEMLSGVLSHLAEKNFGLAAQTLDGVKETFLASLNSLGEEMKTRFDFFLPAVEEAKKEAESMGPNATRKVEEAKKLFEQALISAKKG
jgi:hypothetical protein